MSLRNDPLEAVNIADPKTQLEFTRSIFNKKRQVSRPLSRMRKLPLTHFAILTTKDRSIPPKTFTNGKFFVFIFNAEKLSTPLDRLSIHEFHGDDFITIHMRGRNVATLLEALRNRPEMDRGEFVEEVIAVSKLDLGEPEPEPLPVVRTPEPARTSRLRRIRRTGRG